MGVAKKTTTFEMSYDGDDHREHEIDARSLARALYSMAESIEQADKIINGEESEVEVRVKAHKEGSFEVLLEIIQSIDSVDVLETMGLVKAATAGALGGTALGVIEWLKGRKIEEITIKGGKATIDVGGEQIECPEDVQKLIINPGIRKSFDNLIYKPLAEEGTSVFKIKRGEEQLLEVKKDDSGTFKAPPSTTIERSIEEEYEVNVNFTKINFTGRTGWRMLWDGHDYAVRMNDTVFIERIYENKASFTKDDLFVVKIKKKTNEKNNQLGRPTYSVEKVIRHRATGERKIIKDED